MADGKVSLAFTRFLGYDQGPNGEFVVNEEQAKVVRRIFAEFNKHRSYAPVADILDAEGVPTPTGQGHWSCSTVKSIIANEKYRGDALLQKYYIPDFLTKKLVKNHGEVQQYYVANNHEAIIDPETFEFSQYIAGEISKQPGRFIGGYKLSGRIKCADCGRWFGRRTWHSTSTAHKKNVWQCPNRQRRRHGLPKCRPEHLYESQIAEMTVTALNQLVDMKMEVIKVMKQTAKTIFDVSALEAEATETSSHIEELASELENHVMTNASQIQNQVEYEEKYNDLASRYQMELDKLTELDQRILDKKGRKVVVTEFLKKLENLELVSEYSDDLFLTFVDYVTVDHENHATYTFLDGTETTVDIPKRKYGFEK